MKATRLLLYLRLRLITHLLFLLLATCFNWDEGPPALPKMESTRHLSRIKSTRQLFYLILRLLATCSTWYESYSPTSLPDMKAACHLLYLIWRLLATCCSVLPVDRPWLNIKTGPLYSRPFPPPPLPFCSNSPVSKPEESTDIIIQTCYVKCR